MTKQIPIISPLLRQVLAISQDAMDILKTAVESGWKPEARTVAEDDPSSVGYSVQDGLAIITITGALYKNVSFWGRIFGDEAGYPDISAAVGRALEDRSADGILLNFDSPGGSVDGLFECGEFLYAAARIKPVFTWVDGTCASAAYWLASVSRLISAPPTAMIGSIGVVTMHVDASRAIENMGYKVEYITAGEYKAVGNRYEPLSDKARDYIQERIDQTYALFVDAVARNRDMSTDDVLTMADGKIYLAGPAIEIGLIDRTDISLSAFIQTIAKEYLTMDITELKTKHPDTYDQARAEGRAEAESGIADNIAAAIKAKADQILAVAKAFFKAEDHTKLEKLVVANVTPEQAEAMAAVFANPEGDDGQGGDSTAASEGDAASKQKILEALRAAGNDPLKGDRNGNAGDSQDFEAAVAQHMQTHQCKRLDAMKAIARANPDLHAKWVDDQQSRRQQKS